MATNAALVRPSYITEAQAAKEAAKEEEAYQNFRKSDEGMRIFKEGGYSVKSKRVFIPGHKVGTKGVTSPCPYKTGSFQARVWKAGVESRLQDFDL